MGLAWFKSNWIRVGIEPRVDCGISNGNGYNDGDCRTVSREVWLKKHI